MRRFIVVVITQKGNKPGVLRLHMVLLLFDKMPFYTPSGYTHYSHTLTTFTQPMCHLPRTLRKPDSRQLRISQKSKNSSVTRDIFSQLVISLLSFHSSACGCCACWNEQSPR